MVELRVLRASERERVLDLLETAFGGQRALFTSYIDFDPRYRPEDFRVAAEGDELLACVQTFEKTLRLRGKEVRLGGIGSVATHPTRRKEGLASALLEESIAEMKRRGMALSLLFSTRYAFYGRLGWVSIPRPGWALHRGRPRPEEPRPGEPRRGDVREFRSADLPAVKALYERYCAELETTTVRDELYWAGQLRYAGAPGEDFLVAERRGELVAYARAVSLSGVWMAMEFARRDGGEDALAGLLAALAPEGGPLLVPRVPDPELETALRGRAERVDHFEDPTAMWRVLDRPTLCELAGAARDVDDRALLGELVSGPRAVYWPSDRF